MLAKTFSLIKNMLVNYCASIYIENLDIDIHENIWLDNKIKTV